MNIYVSNLSFNVQDEDLKEFFTPYGDVTSAKIITDRETGRSRGFGFVEMSDDTASKKAIAELNEATVDGRTIKVMEAKPKDILEALPAPKPAATTVATLLKRMQDKGFVGYHLLGNSRQYYPLVKKTAYFSKHVKGMVKKNYR